jgi:hypothetical protein
LKFDSNWSSWKKPFEFDQLDNLYDQIHGAKRQIEKSLYETEKELDSTEAPENLGKIDVRSYVGELIEYIIESIDYDLSPKHIKTVIQDTTRQCQEMAQTADYEVPDDSVLDYAIQSAIYISKIRKYNDLAFILEKHDEIEIVVRMQKPEAEINTLRQGFILLMTIFDATMSDLMRIALKKDFFHLISIVGKQNKIRLESLNKYKSFNEFSEEIIEEQLKQKYIKDILAILECNNIQYIDNSTEFEAIHLIEMIQRRNIHIHNRGIVDEKYLEKDDNGVPRYNIYNLKIGSIAKIDLPYWEMSNKLCKNCVENTSIWIESL